MNYIIAVKLYVSTVCLTTYVLLPEAIYVHILRMTCMVLPKIFCMKSG